MSSTDRRHAEQTRTYDRASSVVFLKTDAPFGGLSNMAGGFPLWVNGIRILTSEALYQTCRFPHRPEVQALIIEQKSPMTAKMKSKPYRHNSRPDWDQVRVKIMRWCLRVKLAQNWRTFSELLLETGERPIVEESRKDAFWGAKANDDGTLVGINVLGRLLMELREAIRDEGRESLIQVKPLDIPDFLLGGRPIEIVASQAPERDLESVNAAITPVRGNAGGRVHKQPSLFDAPVVKEAPPALYETDSAKSVQVAYLKPYAEYKESGLPWLGQVPGHWDVRQARHIGRLFKGVGGTKEDAVAEGLPCVRYGELYTTYKNFIRTTRTFIKPERASDYTPIRFGDVLFAASGEKIEEIGKSAVNLMTAPAVCGGDVIVLRLSVAAHAPYLGYAFDCHHAANQKSTMGRGTTIKHIYPDELRGLIVTLPPPDEQAAIVRFLDWANGRLERAIRAKRKVIALLNEQKQAIIHRAVTRGLDPSVPLKPSGIPWLGDIPQHWEVRRLKHLARFESGDGITSLEIEATGPYPVYGGNGLRGYTTRYTHDGHYALIGRQGALCGNINFAIGQFFASEHAVVPTLQPDMSVVWFGELLRAMNLNQYSQSAAQPGLAVERIKNLYAPVPPVRDQKAIVESFKCDTAPLAAGISRLEREIELLREYRTRLIADLVTGTLDVREAAARLPDEAPLDTNEDDAELSDETDTADEEAAL
ncbi:MAG: DUF1768 domain-containing protein [Betaproteobacteria bacterium]|nr:DUF1768 domain-containing protein [Betaproteobacteria bacterium]